MKRIPKHKIKLHGAFVEKYGVSEFNLSAGSIPSLFKLIFKNALPELLENEKNLCIVFEDEDGNFTEVYDTEQVLPSGNLTIHIMPNPDGAELITLVYAVIVAIVAIGIAMLLAPKIDFSQDSSSGANWQSPENVVGQGGVIPVLLGRRLVGSRVASHGIDSNIYAEYKKHILQGG